jgi:hypothetical protein
MRHGSVTGRSQTERYGASTHTVAQPIQPHDGPEGRESADLTMKPLHWPSGDRRRLVGAANRPQTGRKSTPCDDPFNPRNQPIRHSAGPARV